MEHVKNIDKYIDSIQDWLVLFGGKLLGAAFILLLGFWIINRLVKFLNRIMILRGIDESLRPFLQTLVSITLKVALFIPVIQLLGLATSSFLAILGSAGLAIGLALQGSLANLAGGVILLTLRPFKKGHSIKAAGETGTVHHISIFNTVLKTVDNQTVYIPNGVLAGSTIINYSDEPTRRIVLDFSIRHNDIQLAKKVIQEIIQKELKVLRDPNEQIVITGMSDNAVIISARVWVKNEEYWDLKFELTEKLRVALEEQGVSMPAPQMTISFDPVTREVINNPVKR
jgi:small conductance mechanosensitive channel